MHDLNFETAEALLRPFLDHDRFHSSEFRALMGVQVELAMAKKDRKAAKMWLDLSEMLYFRSYDAFSWRVLISKKRISSVRV